MKRIIITTFSIMMGYISDAQSLHLHNKGVGPIVLGQVLARGIENIFPIEEHSQINRLHRSANDSFDYFFWEPKNGQSLMLDNSVTVSNFFFAINRKNIVEGVFLFIPLKEKDMVIPIINNAFGDAQIGYSGGAEGQTQRVSTYWHKAGVSLFLIQRIGENKAEIFIRIPKLDDGPSPGIFWFSQ